MTGSTSSYLILVRPLYKLCVLYSFACVQQKMHAHGSHLCGTPQHSARSGVGMGGHEGARGVHRVGSTGEAGAGVGQEQYLIEGRGPGRSPRCY